MRPKVLAIDDSLTLREFISRTLSSDYEVILAKDGCEGVAVAAAAAPDLVLLDFVLPDIKGDEVCQRLSAGPKTKHLPIILMSSSAEDMQRTQARFDSVVKAIAKPFTPELLCSAVNCAFRELGTAVPTADAHAEEEPDAASADAAQPGAPQPARQRLGRTSFSCHTGIAPLHQILRALEQDRLSGSLHVVAGDLTIEFHVADGQPLVATTRNAEVYLQQEQHEFSAEQKAVLDEAVRAQNETGCPVFLTLRDKGVLGQREAHTLCELFGWRLFSHAWTAIRPRVKFQSQSRRSRAVWNVKPYSGTMDEWAMETLRQTGDDFLSSMAWGEPTGIPAYTRQGYDRIQEIALTDEELAFANLVSPRNSLKLIAQTMDAEIKEAQRILFRFWCMGIFDYWPASLLRGSSQNVSAPPEAVSSQN